MHLRDHLIGLHNTIGEALGVFSLILQATFFVLEAALVRAVVE
jgi:hypothetical protein